MIAESTFVLTLLQAAPPLPGDSETPAWVAAIGVIGMIIAKLGSMVLEHRRQREEREHAAKQAEIRKREERDRLRREKEERQAWEAAAIRVAVEATTATMESMIESSGEPECAQRTDAVLKEFATDFKEYLNKLAVRDAKREGADRLVSDILDGQARLVRSFAAVGPEMKNLREALNNVLGELKRKTDG